MEDKEGVQQRKQRAIAKVQFTRFIKSIKRHLAMADESIPYQIMDALKRDLLNKWQRVKDAHKE